MTHRFRYLPVFFLLWLTAPALAQARADSLRVVLRSAGEDSNRVNALNALAWELKTSNTDTSVLLSSEALLLSNKIGYAFGRARSYHNLGVFQFRKGNYEEALKQDQLALDAWDSAGKNVAPQYLSYIQKSASMTVGNIGVVYKEKGDYTRALNYFFEALRQARQFSNKTLQTNMLGSIGSVFEEQNDFTKALDYYKQSLEIARSTGNKSQVALLLGNMGVVYWNLKDYPKALDYQQRALEADRELKNKNAVARHLGNIGLVYQSMGDFDQAMHYYEDALALDQEIGNKKGIAIVQGNIGELYLHHKKFTEAGTWLERALRSSREIGSLNLVKENYRLLSDLSASKGDWNGALAHYKNFIAARDSIFNEENTKKQTQAEMQYEFDKKEANAKAEQEKKDAVAAADARKQKIILISVAGCLMLVLAFAVFIYRSFLQKQKANLEIGRQKNIIEEKQKEILGSIHYAKRIQTSLLPTEKYIVKCLEENGRSRVDA